MPVRVLYVSHTPEQKGSAMSLYQLMTRLDRSLYEPVAAFSKPGPLVDRLNAERVHALVLASRGPLGIGLVREAMGVIKRERIGIVHLNSAVPFCKYVGMAARLSGLPVVWHIREDPQGKRVNRLAGWIARLSQRIIAVSTDIEDRFRHTGKVLKIYNGVDTDVFRPGLDGGPFRERYGIPSDAFVFGMVGTIEPRKGVLNFLGAAARLVTDGLPVRFVIVGTGLPEHVSEVERFIGNTGGLKDAVALTGRLTDVPGALAGMDTLVMPSGWEGFPRALIEAMACGVPAIANEVGEVGHIVDDGVNGILLRPGDDEALYFAMKRFADGAASVSELGRRAAEKAAGRYDISGHVDRVQSVYGELLGGARGR